MMLYSQPKVKSFSYAASTASFGAVRNYHLPMAIDADTIINQACRDFGVTVLALASKTRKREVVLVRQLCMAAIQRNTPLSLRSTGELFNRDHTTVIHAKKAINDHLDTPHSEERKEILNFLKRHGYQL